MSKLDIEMFEEAKPYIIGILAALHSIGRDDTQIIYAFNWAEPFVAEFERRNGIAK
jgi:hypothetical protein